MNDNNREILTTKIIIREINNRYVKSIVLRIIVFILFLCSLSIYFVIENFYLLKLLLNFGYVAVLFIMFADILFRILIINKINKQCFILTTDKLVEKYKKEKVYHYFGFYITPYRLQFAKNSMYNIPYGKNYKFSKVYNMSCKSVYNSAKIGDEFYIIIVNFFNQDKIILAYNSKFFKYNK